MFDIFSRISIIAGEAIEEITDKQEKESISFFCFSKTKYKENEK